MATPTCIQARMTPNIVANAAPSVWKQRFARQTGSGNLYVLALQWGSSAATVTSVVDDKGNNWASFTAVSDAGNNQSAQIWYLKNGTAGTKFATITLSAGEANVSVLGPYEWNNVDTSASPTDGSAGRTNVGTAISSGSFTTTVQDLIFHAVFLDSFTAPATRMTWSAAAGYTLLTPDGGSFQCAQWSVQNAGPQNPALTLGVIGSSTGISCTGAFKVLSGAGTPRASGIGANRVSYHSFPGYMVGIVDAAAWPFQFPCEGNLLVIGAQTKNNNTVSSISDTNGNVWAACGTAAKDAINDHVVEFWYAKNATPSETMTVTITWGTATGGTPSSSPTVYLVDVTGADTINPLAQSANASGNLAAASGTTNGATISAPAVNGLILGFQQEVGETITGVTPGLILSPDIGLYSTDGAEKDGGFMAHYPLDGTAVQAVWTYSNYEAGVLVDNWVNQLVSFKAAGPPPAPPTPAPVCIYVMP